MELLLPCVLDSTRNVFGYIVTWLGRYIDANMNYFTWYKKHNDWVVIGCM